jgi:hypothetical protein
MTWATDTVRIGIFFSVVKRPEQEAVHSPPSNAAFNSVYFSLTISRCGPSGTTKHAVACVYVYSTKCKRCTQIRKLSLDMWTVIRHLFLFQTVLLAASIICRMVLVEPGYVPAHAIDYYVSTLQSPLSAANPGTFRNTWLKFYGAL